MAKVQPALAFITDRHPSLVKHSSVQKDKARINKLKQPLKQAVFKRKDKNKSDIYPQTCKKSR